MFPNQRGRRAAARGRKARADGIPVTANPYVYLPVRMGTALAGWWDKGWHEEDRRRKAE